MEPEEKDDVIMHYGIKRRSGRYPWGSGEEPYQHMGDFISRVQSLQKKGMNYTQIAKEMKMTTNDFKVQYAVAENERRALLVAKVKSLKHQGVSNMEIARRLGIKNESTVRSYLDEDRNRRMNAGKDAAVFLENKLKEANLKTSNENGAVIDVGAASEKELGISRHMMDQAIFILQTKGYNVYGVGLRNQTNPEHQINTMVIAPKDMSYGQAYKAEMDSVGDYHSDDGGKTFRKLQYPSSISSDRVKIRYADDKISGKDMDGVIQLRRGVQDLDLGNDHYSQVRIMVDGTHYLKGMAMYSDDIPDGYDVVFNTNKTSDVPKMKVLKKIGIDPENPFGATIKANGQSVYIDKKTGEEKLNAVNKVKEEGDWFDNGHGQISAQFLSKQPKELIKKQLDYSYMDKLSEYEEIKSINNPTVKRKLLLDYAANCDKAAVDLKAAAFPREKWEVILPVRSMKETEVYAPNFKNGEKVALVRFPHAGTFEIPICTVNNNQKEAKSSIGNVKDAIGISAKVAERLSGADFDGDSVVVIPFSQKVKIKSSDPLPGLKDFDPKIEYGTKEVDTGKFDKKGQPIYDYVDPITNKPIKIMTKQQKGIQMGEVSNLITDMTIKGASPDELARAVRHSMVVIDAEKHHLDYKKSERDNNIAELKSLYQGHYDKNGKYKESGASTLISRAKAVEYTDKNYGSPYINKKEKSGYDPSKPEGTLIYKRHKETYYDKKNGKVVERLQKSTQMAETTDARTLSSGTVQEEYYAEYANRCKALANSARLEYLATPAKTYSPQANKVYAKQVATLEAKLDIAERNRPKERLAQYMAGQDVYNKVAELGEEMPKKDLKKYRQQAINRARDEVGASGKKSRINIEPDEWTAIQAGAISNHKASKILEKADPDQVRQYALPKATTKLSKATVTKIKGMANTYTNAEIAELLGVSVSTVSRAINDKI